MRRAHQLSLPLRHCWGPRPNPRPQTCIFQRPFFHTSHFCEASRTDAGKPEPAAVETQNEHAQTQPAQDTSSSTPPTSPPPSSNPSHRARSRFPILIHFAAISAVVAGAFYYANETRKARFLLNDTRFMPCPVISNEPAGHDAFILTIQTPLTALMQTTATRTNCHVVDEAWRHGLWSVEVKQPQLQIARNYTPLPPTSSVKDGAADSNRSDPEQQRRIDAGIVPLSFYIRRYDGGEVSTYLSRMQPGDLVEIRGPHLGFDLAARLGEAGKKVVFLAGGTGIAPALQAASRLLDSGLAPTSSDDGGRDDAHLITTPSPTSQVQDVTILWANRSAVACAGCERLNKTVHSSRGFWSWMGGRQSSSDPSLDPSSDTSPTQPSEDANREPSSAIMQQLYALQLAYERQGRTLQVRCVVDEEGSRITANDIANVVSKHSHINKDTTSRGQVAAGSLQNDSSTTCHLHTQRRLEHATESDDAANNGAGILDLKRCDCTRQGFGGKNLFMICGPDGFVSAYVGPKVWADGAERQGRIGGVVAELIKKNPQMWKDWLVLKQ